MSNQDFEKIKNQIKRSKGTIIGISFIAVFLIGFILFNPIHNVSQTEYALKVNRFNNQVESTVYTANIYFFIDGDFIKFPSTLQVIEFSDDTSGLGSTSTPLSSRTQDGLDMRLEMSFQYKLIKENIYDLYIGFAMDYERTYIQQARDVLRDVASKYSAIQFFYNRTIIGNQMHDALQFSFLDLYAEVPLFQLREVDLPDSFENALERVQVAQQEYEVARFEQQAAIVRAETKILEAQAQANITLLSAEADAEAFKINMEAQAEALNVTLSTQSLAYYGMAQQLNMTSTELLTLLWIMAIMNHDSSMLIIGENTPILLPITNSTSTSG